MYGGHTTEAENLTHREVPDYFARRQPLERALALVLLLPASPIILVLAVVVRVTSRGSSIYRQQRVGKDGKTFNIYKLRTMVDGAEHLSGPVWCLPGDSRITPVGRLLRRLHLDELPQLLNVVRGEMSLVGPRPERPELVETLAHTIPHYADRFLVLPGLTGLAQIQLPPDTDQQSVRNKTALDLHYIHCASANQDLRIVCYTLLKVLGLRRPVPHTRPSTHSHLPHPVENGNSAVAATMTKKKRLGSNSSVGATASEAPPAEPRLPL